MASFTRAIVYCVRYSCVFAWPFPIFSFFAFAVGLGMLQNSLALEKLNDRARFYDTTNELKG
jgi:hypothetical protein